MAKLYFNFSAMNAGKSAILLQSSYNYQERGMHTMLLKPVIDSRDPRADHIVSRIGLNAQANTFCNDMNLESFIISEHKKKALNCVLVDEAQFLTSDQVWQLSHIADDHNIPVMCYGLRTDFKGELFSGSATLLAVADSLREIKTLCWCGRKASMTLRVSESGKLRLAEMNAMLASAADIGGTKTSNPCEI